MALKVIRLDEPTKDALQAALGDNAKVNPWRELVYPMQQFYKGGSPILSKTGSDWEAAAVGNPYIYSLAGNRYVLIYQGSSAAGLEQVGCAVKDMSATAPAWARGSANPIIAVGSSGAWDDLRCGFPCGFFDESGGKWRFWYAGCKSADILPTTIADYAGIGYAETIGSGSPPWGTAPTKSSLNPIITRTVVATSLGISIDNLGAIVAPRVVRDHDGLYHMWFGAQIKDVDTSYRYRMIYATSYKPDQNWEIHGSIVYHFGFSPSWFDKESGVLTPVGIDGLYVATFDGSQTYSAHVQVGIAFSSDGLHWFPLPWPLLNLGDVGAWDDKHSAVSCMCSLLREGIGFYMLYWGQRASDDESQIGEALCIVTDHLPLQILHNATALTSATASDSKRVFTAPYQEKILYVSATKTLSPGDLTVRVQISDDNSTWITLTDVLTLSATGTGYLAWTHHSTWIRIEIQAASADATNYWTVTTKVEAKK